MQSIVVFLPPCNLPADSRRLSKLNIIIGADHGGYHLKEIVNVWLKGQGYSIVDVGAHRFDPEDDYPVFAFAVALRVGKEDIRSKPWRERTKGILVCRSAAGMVITANKVKGVRAVAVVHEASARHSRQHNDANVLGLSGDWMSTDQALAIVKVWLETDFTGEARHERRIQMIEERQL